MMLIIIHKFLALFQVIFAFYMCTTLSAIEAVLSLILTFLVVGLILFSFDIEFLGVSYVIVYVGAIAILFLFVIMITPLKNATSDLQSYHFANILNTREFSTENKTLFLTILALLVFYIPDLFFSDFCWSIPEDENDATDTNILCLIEELSNLSFLAQGLFNYTSFFVLISGIILLVALLGVCLLTFFNLIDFFLFLFIYYWF